MSIRRLRRGNTLASYPGRAIQSVLHPHGTSVGARRGGGGGWPRSPPPDIVAAAAVRPATPPSGRRGAHDADTRAVSKGGGRIRVAGDVRAGEGYGGRGRGAGMGAGELQPQPGSGQAGRVGEGGTASALRRLRRGTWGSSYHGPGYPHGRVHRFHPQLTQHDNCPRGRHRAGPPAGPPP